MTFTPVSQQVRFDRRLIDKYNRSGPRYTSYPTAPHFQESFGPEAFRQAIRDSQESSPDRPISLYVHIPFCDTVCYYCACNRVVTPDRSRAAHYLRYLFQEIERVGALVDRRRPVVQLHLGGGTPTYLDARQLIDLRDCLASHFTLLEKGSGEYGIEVDPREVPPGTITTLAEIGFNRISIGVQDLDPRVQKAVNRIQSLDLTEYTIHEARDAGFRSVNLDLIYGLPFQTADSFQQTLITVVERLQPDRLAVFNYAHLPQYFPPQRRINETDLPSPEEKLRILESTIDILTAAGYVYIGMDHFAKPEDELAIAQRQGILHRNFQGYTTHGECDLIGLGNTSISQVGPTFSQNQRELEGYYQQLDQGELTVFRGLVLSRDDLIRQEVIRQLICNFQMDRATIEQKFGLTFSEYFSIEEHELQAMAEEGLLSDHAGVISISPAGRLLIRNVCMVFDWYLRNAEQKKKFSQTI